MALKDGSKRETKVKKAGAGAPVLRADRIMGHAAQRREHSRGTPGRERPAGSKVRQSRTEPPARAKQQRRSPRSGSRSGA
jgi:hypothetical protein